MTLSTGLEHAYLADYRATQNHDVSRWMVAARAQAMARFRSVGIPDLSHESWRDMDLSLLRQKPFRFAGRQSDFSRLTWDNLGIEMSECLKLVFVNGVYEQNLSDSIHQIPGLDVGHLADNRWMGSTWLSEFLCRLSQSPDESFAALNTAFLNDGAIIRVAPGVVVDKPIHVAFVSTGLGEQQVVHPRLLVVAETGSSVEILETHTGDGTLAYWSNSVTEVFLGESSSVHHVYDEREPDQAIHFNALRAMQKKDSTLQSVRLNFGGGLVRNDVDVTLKESGARCSLNGLFFGRGKQHLDNRIWVRHQSPDTHSSQVMKGVLDDRASGSFLGRILVAEDAQKITAEQTNRNLLLSDNAKVQAKPQLEIYADDVRCTHAATTGEIDEEAVFYFQSRGVDAEMARQALIIAFMKDVVACVKWDRFRQGLSGYLEKKLVQPGEK